MTAATSALIEDIRASSRLLAQRFGFMGGAFAGTDLHPSAVHALIEIGAGGATARDLAASLGLDKSTVSRMLARLVAAGEVQEGAGAGDGRLKPLSLTESGMRRLAAIHGFARAQVRDALDHLARDEVQTVRDGLRLYAQALGAAPGAAQQCEILPGYRTGIIARVTEMHATYYARESGFGQPFESLVAGGLAGFCTRLSNPQNQIWAAVQGGAIVGSIAIDAEDMGPGIAHLRWFIVDDHARGTGAGRRLLSAALAFADAQALGETHLWTFSGLTSARHLYEEAGFALAEQRPGAQWGREVLEQRFVRKRG